MGQGCRKKNKKMAAVWRAAQRPGAGRLGKKNGGVARWLQAGNAWGAPWPMPRPGRRSGGHAEPCQQRPAVVLGRGARGTRSAHHLVFDLLRQLVIGVTDK